MFASMQLQNITLQRQNIAKTDINQKLQKFQSKLRQRPASILQEQDLKQVISRKLRIARQTNFTTNYQSKYLRRPSSAYKEIADSHAEIKFIKEDDRQLT